MSNMARPHRIRKLGWRVMTTSEEGAFTLKRDLRRQWEVLVLAAFEKGLDILCEKNQVIHIPKIVLNIKVDSEEALAEQLPRRIYQALLDQLPVNSKPRLKSPELRNQKHPISRSSSESSSKSVSTDEDHFASFITYLQTGIVPWHIAHLPVSQIETQFKTVLFSSWIRLFKILNKNNAEPEFYFRLLQILSAEEMLAFVSDLSETLPQICSERCGQALNLLQISPKNTLSRHSQLRLSTAFLSEGHRVGSADLPNLATLADKVLNREDQRIFLHFVSKLEKKSAHLFLNASEDDPEKVRSIQLVPPGTEVLFPHADPFGQEHALSETRSEDIAFASDLAHSTLKVKHAGLILLHPFLSGLFKHCAFIKDTQQGLSPVVQAKAAALLHFLATGAEAIYEYELGLIKLLLGLEPEVPLLVSEGLLSESEKNEASDLLSAAIQHWSALKSTSASGFRSTFLSRQGLLRKEDQDWKLHIERTTVDVLLDRLPWSISIIKLPWMKRPLYTEW